MSDRQVKQDPRRNRARRRVTGLIIGLAVLSLAFIAYFLSPYSQQESAHIPYSITANEVPLDSLFANSMSLPVSAKVTAECPVFPYSVIPGGVHSGQELMDAAKREPVVAAHYAQFVANHARVICLVQDKLAYVSYRLGNHIFWTKKKVTLHKGERLLNDGEHLARTRCGNRVSVVAMAPTSPQEPAEKVLNRPLVPAHLDVAPPFVPDEPRWSENAVQPTLLALNSVTPGSGSIPGGWFPPLIPTFCCGGGKSSPTSPLTPIYPLPQQGYPSAPPLGTPEPSTLLLFLLGLVFVALLTHLRPTR